MVDHLPESLDVWVSLVVSIAFMGFTVLLLSCVPSPFVCSTASPAGRAGIVGNASDPSDECTLIGASVGRGEDWMLIGKSDVAVELANNPSAAAAKIAIEPSLDIARAST